MSAEEVAFTDGDLVALANGSVFSLGRRIRPMRPANGTIKVRVSPNRTLTGHDGVLYRAGDEVDAVDDDTVAQWLSAGMVTKMSTGKPARKGTRA